MKRYIIVCMTIILLGVTGYAGDFTYLDPPTVSVMDFEVSIGWAEDDKSKEYYGGLINHTLVTMLIAQNASDIVIENARYYFPPLLKIYDKKYVELALQNNRYSTSDLYDMRVDAFNFAELDYVVLGNVYETRRKVGDEEEDSIGINVRVLNTRRAEELYSYTAVVDADLSSLVEKCRDIARYMIRDIVNRHCAQFIIKDKSEESVEYRLFCQSRLEKDNENNIVPSDDSYKKEVYTKEFYWVLPGEYIITVYNETSQSVNTIPFSIDVGDIKQLDIEKKHLEVEKGSITVEGIFPVDTYFFTVREKERKTEYRWEIGRDIERHLHRYSFLFVNGQFSYPYAFPDADMDELLEYNAASNKIVLKDIMLSKYDIVATYLPYMSDTDSIRRPRITFLLRPAFHRRIQLEIDDDTRQPLQVPIYDKEKSSSKVNTPEMSGIPCLPSSMSSFSRIRDTKSSKTS